MAFWKDSHIPLWPLTSSPKQWTGGGSFGASRDGGSRKHQGIDLYAPKNAPVIALEDGVVRGVQGWSGKGTKGLWIDHPKMGASVLYGAVAPGSYPPAGSKVSKGEQVATIGVYPKGSTMLHLEAWKLGQFKPRPEWNKGDAPPSNYDITSYLEAAKGNPLPNQDDKQDVCGGDVTASDGSLTLSAPCSTINGVQVCSGFDISSWQDSLGEEIEASTALILATELSKKDSDHKVKAALTYAKESNFKGQTIKDKWGLFTYTPGDAVQETSEAARKVRCAKLSILSALNPQDNQGGNGGGGGGQGNGGGGNGGGNGGSGSSGGGAAIGIAVLIGAGLYLRSRKGR